MPPATSQPRSRPEQTHTPASSERAAYSPDELAALLGASRAWVYLRLSDGTIPSVKIGRRRFIRAAAVDELLAAGDAA